MKACPECSADVPDTVDWCPSCKRDITVKRHAGAPPGWHPDPDDKTSLRYWDGEQWSGERAPKPPAPQRQTSALTIARGVALGIGAAIAIWWLIAQFTGPSPVEEYEQQLRELSRMCREYRQLGQEPPECAGY